MSLGRLLTTGKSLVGLHDSNARYQLRTGALPKFESSKNPFAKPHAEPEPQAALPKLSDAEIAAANLKKTEALPVLSEVRETPEMKPLLREEVQQAREAARVAEIKKGTARPSATVTTWLNKLNPLVWMQSRKPGEGKAAVPRFSGGSKRPVQGELSLDKVTVKRNDLSETDVEVVPMKARPAKASVTQLSDAPKPESEPAKKALDYLNERLLGKH